MANETGKTVPTTSTKKRLQDQVANSDSGSYNNSTVQRGAKIGKHQSSTPDERYVGSLADTFDAKYPTAIDIVSDFPWTTSKVFDRDDVPYILLTEHRNNENLLKRNLMFYGQGGVDQVGSQLASVVGNNSMKNLLSVYDEIWPDNPTGWVYSFPHFSKSQYELSTPQWQGVDANPIEQAGNAASETVKGLAKVTGSSRLQKLANFVEGANAVTQAGMAAGKLALQAQSPLVNVFDKPRIFQNHAERSITIQFPLYNTVGANDWKKNRNFWQVFASQNLFNKRDFITGLPPVFYRVYIPGQYYSHASCVTNFSVENLGNVRLASDEEGEHIVPDAYQINITVTELLMPSLNQFQVVLTGEAQKRVTVSKPAGTAVGAVASSKDTTKQTSAFKGGGGQSGGAGASGTF